MAEHTPQRAVSRWEPWRKRYALVSDILTPQRIGLVLAVALLGIVGVVGGWDAVEGVETPEVPVVEVGTLIEAAPFEVTVRRARHFERLPNTLPSADGFRYLALSLDVTVRNDQWVSFTDLKNAVRLEADSLRPLGDEPGRRPDPTLLRGLDALPVRSLQPGLTTSTIVVWQQSTDVPVPNTVTVELDQQTWRQSTLDGGWRWSDGAPVARVTLPVEALDA